MSTSPQSGGGLFSRLKRGRSRLDIKDGDPTASRISDAEKSFDITPSKPSTAKPTPSLSLPLSFANASQSNLREDTGISKFLSTQGDVGAPKSNDDSKLEGDAARDTPQKPATSYSTAVSDAIDGMERTSSKSKESSNVGTLQSRIILEMKEKEQLMGRFEALSRVHMALQEEVQKERSRAEKAEASARNKPSPERGPSSNATGAAGAVAGTVTTTEVDGAIKKEKAVLEEQKSTLASEKEEMQRREVRLKQEKADMERDKTAMELERTEVARQRDAHASLLAERQTEKDTQVSQQSELESNRAKDKELHASQLSELESHRAKDKELHASQLSELEASRAKDKELHASKLSELETSRAKDKELHSSQISDINARLSTTSASLNDSNAEIARLRELNIQLKNNMSKSSQFGTQTTDAEFVEEMDKLSQDVQSWVTNNFRKSRVDFEKLEKAGDSKDLKFIRKVVPRYREAAEKAKLPFLQALVSARLMDEVWDDDFFIGMPGLVEEHKPEDESSRTSLAYLREAYKALSASASGDDLHTWRATTVSLLRRTHDPYLTNNTKKLVTHVGWAINNLLSSITSASSETTGAVLGSSPLPSRVRDLQAFVSKTIDLARLFRAQRPVFAFSLPGSVESSDGLIRTVSFEQNAMDDVTENEELKDKTVVAAVWPLVMRLEDEGRIRNVVVKAKVICEAK